MPSVVSNPILDRHIELTVAEMIAQLDHASSRKTRAKTGYYKIAIVLSVSILEALLYHYIERAVAEDRSLLSLDKVKTPNHKHIQDLGTVNSYTSDLGHEFCMHKVEKLDFVLTEKTNLGALNKFCYDSGLIGTQLRKGIKTAQDKRNQIHLQGLRTTSYRYNAQMLDRVLGTILKVYTKIENI